jgi:hypothetical protein
MITKDQAVDKLMHSDVDSFRETCYYAYKDQHGIKGHHLLNWPVAELVSWWITYYEWNEACQMWEFRVFDSI